MMAPGWIVFFHTLDFPPSVIFHGIHVASLRSAGLLIGPRAFSQVMSTSCGSSALGLYTGHSKFGHHASRPLFLLNVRLWRL